LTILPRISDSKKIMAGEECFSILFGVKGTTMKWWDLLRGKKATMLQAAIGLLLVFGASASPATATPPFPTPEIDPGSLTSALTLLIGGMMILTARRRSR
jgi:hypothetical protein